MMRWVGAALLALGAVASAVPRAAAQDAAPAALDTASVDAPASTTTAPPPDATADAQAMFRRAVELGDVDRWAEALELFRRSLTLVARPSTRFNVGFALYRLGRFREAIETFDAYLTETEGETSELRTEALARREQAVLSLAELALEVEPDAALVRVDGQTVDGTGPTRVLPLDPGRHIVLATAPGYVDAQLEVSVLAAEHEVARLALAPIATDEVELVEDSVVDAGGGGGLERDPIFWVVTGLLVAAAGVGIGVGVALGQDAAPSLYTGSTGVVLRMP